MYDNTETYIDKDKTQSYPNNQIGVRSIFAKQSGPREIVRICNWIQMSSSTQ